MGSTARIRQFIFKSKALLCVLLVLNLHAWIAGCTGPAEVAAPLAGIMRIELSADHALTKALNKSVLVGAKAIEIDPVRKSFRIVFAEANREVAGTYAVIDGAFTITQFTFGRLGRSVTLYLDLSKRVRTIATDDGFVWQRPANWLMVTPSSDGVQGYVEANAQLLNIAKDLDQGRPPNPGNGTTNPGNDGDFDAALSALVGNKTNSADAAPLLLVLGTILAIWGPLLGTLAALLGIFLVIALIQALLGDFVGSALDLPPPPNDEPPPVDPVPPDDSISLSVTASRNWTYEHLVSQGTPVNNCEVSFNAVVDNDPLSNSGYSYVWTITPPADRPGAAFTPVSGETTANPAFLPAARPASSANDYVVTVVATGNDRGNVGMATTTIKVRLLGDTDNSGCVDQADIDFVNFVEANNVTDPDMVLRADVNCDETTNYVLDASLVDFVRLDLDGLGNGCLLEACCMADGSCSDLIAADCSAAGGTAQGMGTTCATTTCPNAISLSVTASRAWTYEHLIFNGTPVNNCEVSFIATVDNDPLGNTGYSYVWTITPPADRHGAAFTPVSGETTANPTFLPAARPASSANDYVVTVVATGNDQGNVGMATTTIKVRLLGDTDNSGCVDQADIDFVNFVEANNVTDPEMVLRADVNCDETTNYVLDASLVDFVRLDLDGQGNGSCN